MFAVVLVIAALWCLSWGILAAFWRHQCRTARLAADEHKTTSEFWNRKVIELSRLHRDRDHTTTSRDPHPLTEQHSAP